LEEPLTDLQTACFYASRALLYIYTDHRHTFHRHQAPPQQARKELAKGHTAERKELSGRYHFERQQRELLPSDFGERQVVH
jgi:hypothetical protein